MAHRKPIGTTCHTVADWEGDRPTPGDYLVTQAGTWYRVLGVEEKANPKKLGLLLERILLPDEDGKVFGFEWYPRDRKRAA